VKDIDKSENLTPKQKSVAWKRFLAAVAQDNPYSQQDDKMRSFSISRLSHWENVKPVKIQKPVPVDDFTTQGSKVTARDGILVAYASGVVYDKNTGLEWYAGPDEDINWYEAKSWVQSLNIAGGGWRMPTRKEIESLHKKAVRTRNVTSLLKITEYFVWSGEIKGPSEYARAGVFYFRYGGQDAWLTCSGSDEMRVFAVRSRR